MGYELAKLNYDIDANDYNFSNIMLCDYLFNYSKKDQFEFEPLIRSFSNYLTEDMIFKKYTFPDEDINLQGKGKMTLTGGDFIQLFYGKKGLVGSTLAKIDVKENYIELVYQFLKINEKYITENTTGSAIPHTDKGLVLSLRLPISEKLTEYSDKFKNIRLAIISNNNEIMKLQHLRDILLPKLMSGEIDVSKINCDLD